MVLCIDWGCLGGSYLVFFGFQSVSWGWTLKTGLGWVFRWLTHIMAAGSSADTWPSMWRVFLRARWLSSERKSPKSECSKKQEMKVQYFLDLGLEVSKCHFYLISIGQSSHSVYPILRVGKINCSSWCGSGNVTFQVSELPSWKTT